MWKLTILTAAAALVATAPAFAGPRSPLTIAVFGDAPYGTSPADTSQLEATPSFIKSVNSDPDVSLVVHVGDIHSGKQYCTEVYDRQVFNLWKAFKDPVVYTPGDNEWADCHKSAEGGGTYNPATGNIDYVLDAGGHAVDYAQGNPAANLELIRSIFFRDPGFTLGRRKAVVSQAGDFDPEHRSDRKFVENVMWQQAGVLFVTIDLPGGSNNDKDIWYGAPAETPAQFEERQERTGADLRWLDAAFDVANENHVRGIVIVAQADMWDPEKGVEHQAGYEPFVRTVARRTLELRVPVLMLNGDSHVYLSDNPLSASDPLNYMHPGYNVPNFHRIVVHGSTTPLEWLKLTVNPRANAPQSVDALGPFSWKRIVQQ